MKNTVEDLAIFGGFPCFEAPLHVGRPNIGDRERLMDRINGVLDRRWLSNHGPMVKQFEDRLSEVTGARHCIAMCNGTVALEIAIRAAGLTGEVIVPSFTFIATAHALQWLGVTPVFCDVDPSTHSLDPEAVEAAITSRTTGIMGVHLWGRLCAVEPLADIAERYGLKLLFDAAHAFGCTHRGRMVGNFGDAEVFSFHATKFLNSFEGGAVATNDDELAGTIRLMRNFGFAGYDHVISVGTNGKMSEVSAAMGLTGLESMDEFIHVNRRNFELYQRELAGVPGIRMFEYEEDERSNFQYVVLEVDEEPGGVSRDLLISILHAENVLARRYFFPGCHRMEPYRSHLAADGPELPVTEKLTRRVLALPTGTALGGEQIVEICELIRFVVRNGVEIARRAQPESAGVGVS